MIAPMRKNTPNIIETDTSDVWVQLDEIAAWIVSQMAQYQVEKENGDVKQEERAQARERRERREDALLPRLLVLERERRGEAEEDPREHKEEAVRALNHAVQRLGEKSAFFLTP